MRENQMQNMNLGMSEFRVEGSVQNKQITTTTKLLTCDSIDLKIVCDLFMCK